MSLTPIDPLLQEITGCASRVLGFRHDAIEPRAVARAARRLRSIGSSDAELSSLCRQNAGSVASLITEEVTVDETYFFRAPAQFELVAAMTSKRSSRSGADVVRGWSAGCANGAEAYSLAATLRASAPLAVRVEVLGTDVAAHNIARAVRGEYPTSSVRDSGPLLFDALTRRGGAGLRVAPHVRPLVSFAVHNLLDSAPLQAHFDFIFCRNVLVYMRPEAIERVTDRLFLALAPGGVIVFGAGDLVHLPPRLSPVAAPELAAYGRTRSSARPPRGDTRRIGVEAPNAGARSGPQRLEVVALHLQALAGIERGDDAAADQALTRLLGLDEGYIPGIIERALLLNRRGDTNTAIRMMVDALRRTAHLPSEAVITGPRELPLRFYRQSAEAFLDWRRAP